MSRHRLAAKLRHEIGGTAAVLVHERLKRLSRRQYNVARNCQLCCMYAVANEYGLNAGLAGTCTQIKGRVMHITAKCAALHFPKTARMQSTGGRVAGCA